MAEAGSLPNAISRECPMTDPDPEPRTPAGGTVPGERTRMPGDEAAPGSPQTGDQICPRCQGSGRIEAHPCPDCGGSGRVVQIVGDA